MIPNLSSLRTKLMASHLSVIVIGATVLILTMSWLAPSYFKGDVLSMNEMMGQTNMMSNPEMMGGSTQGFLTPAVEAGLRDAFSSALKRALAVAVGVSALAGLLIATMATKRILSPLESIRQATRRMAGGSYEARAVVPTEAELAAVVQDVNALARALDETEQRRVRLISEVAHELRTPLATIEGYLEGLLDGVFEPTPEMFAAWDREVRRLKRLTGDLSTLSTAEEGSQQMAVEDFDLSALVTEVGSRLGPQFEAENVALDLEVEPALKVKGDRDRVSQVLVNVIGNALAYTPEGGNVRVHAGSGSGLVKVEVTDTGRGLTPEQQEHVFERFYRADKSGPAGTGIGLTIARSIARRHGGEVTASSPGLGKGSTFRIELPL